MRRLWAKIIIAGLIILGEGALASEIRQRSDDRFESCDSPAVVAQKVFLDDYGSSWNPPSPCIYVVCPQISLAQHQVAVVNTLSLDPFDYHPFNPRAPPVPAS